MLGIGNEMNIGKRLMNVLTILCTLFIAMLFFLMATGNVSDWKEFLIKNFGLAFLAYATTVTVNYILFGKATLWHIVRNA